MCTHFQVIFEGKVRGDMDPVQCFINETEMTVICDMLYHVNNILLTLNLTFKKSLESPKF